MISSVRPLGGYRRPPPVVAPPAPLAVALPTVLPPPPPPPPPAVVYQVPPTYEAPVSSMRIIVSPPNQRCRIERRGAADVPVCENLPGSATELYEVRYYFRGNLRTTHMLIPPGRRIAVNDNGDPVR